LIIPGAIPNVDIAFTGAPDEIFNINIETISPEIESKINRYASRQIQEMGGTILGAGFITVEGKTHPWLQYHVVGKIWTKKYLFVIDGIGYAITASCNDQTMIYQREKNWDKVVESFHLL
jgi:hypothetical protein